VAANVPHDVADKIRAYLDRAMPLDYSKKIFQMKPSRLRFALEEIALHVYFMKEREYKQQISILQRELKSNAEERESLLEIIKLQAKLKSQ
jgi:hypothetical protein